MNKSTDNNAQSKSNDAAGMVFPCEIDVKIFIHNHPDTLASIKRFVALQLDTDELMQWSDRPSSGGKYLAITARVRSPSREHIDALYQALSDHQDVIMMI